jgi:asparagine synthase (glutamine-hydrolysing)
MRVGAELREPFLDHRLVELAVRQPLNRKINGNSHKWMLRRIAADLLPRGVAEAPKRPVQTPQREWLRGPLFHWAQEQIEIALAEWGDVWLSPSKVRAAWRDYLNGAGDNSFFIWQWASLALSSKTAATAA